jgi:Tfp pilus assembly protein PilF
MAVLMTMAWTPRLHADALQEAEAAWVKRSQPGERQRAITLWQQALKDQPQRTEIYTTLAKAASSAYRHATDGKEKKRWADMALQYGKEATEKNPNSAEAYARYGEALGQWAQANKGLQGLRRVKDAVAALEKAIAIDPKHSFAHMLLSEFFREAPASVSVGDKVKALEQAKLAVETGPGIPINHLALAKAYRANGQNEAAIAELQKILTLSVQTPEGKIDQDKARALLKEMGAADTAAAPAAAQTCSDSSECPGTCIADKSVAAGHSTSGTCTSEPVSSNSCQNQVLHGKAQGSTCKE